MLMFIFGKTPKFGKYPEIWKIYDELAGMVTVVCSVTR